MPIFGNQVSKLVDDFLNPLDIFRCSTENPLVKDIGVRKDSLANNFDISVGKVYDGASRTFSLW